MFNYENGKIIHGNRHNPERIAYLESINEKDDRFNMVFGDVDQAANLITKFNDNCLDGIFLMNQLVTNYPNYLSFFIEHHNKALSTEIDSFVEKYIDFYLFVDDMLVDDAIMYLNDSYKTRMLMIYWLLQRDDSLFTPREKQLFYISYLAICVFNYLYRRISMSEELSKLIINIQQRIYACINNDSELELMRLVRNITPTLFNEMLVTLAEKYKTTDNPLFNYGSLLFKFESGN
jgi:hypothetical protein